MASAQQLIGLVKSHAEGDEARFYDLAIQLAAAEEQKGHVRLAEQLRTWADAGKSPPPPALDRQPLLAAPRGDLAELIGASYPATRLTALILPTMISEELCHVIMECRQRDRLEARGLHPRRRLLLAGPPGTGKTMTGAALAGELKFPLFTVLLHGLITKFFGETATKLRLIFDAIRTTRGVYLFDEIDALAGARTSSNDVGEARRVLNSFLQFLEEDPGPSLIVATTNVPELLDSAILRRFDLVLRYELPGEDAVIETVKRRLGSFDASDIAWGAVAPAGLGLPPADLVRATEDAARRVVLSGDDKVSTQVLLDAFDRRRALQMIGSSDGTTRQASPRRSSRGSGEKIQTKRKPTRHQPK